MKNQTVLIVLVLSLLAGFGLGFFTGRQQNPSSISVFEKNQNALVPVNGTLSITGVIKKIQGNVLTMEITLPPAVREITVGDNTQIVINEFKDQTVYAGELKAYEKAFVTTTPASPPQPFVEKVLELSDLKVGDLISAEAATDIKNASSFTATRILVIQKAFSAPVSSSSTSSTNSGVLPATQ